MVRMVPKLNIVIPARCEYPQIVWTVYSLLNDIPPEQPHQIVVVSNGEDDETRKMDKWFSGGALAKSGRLKILTYDEAFHPYTAHKHAIDTLQLEGLLCYCCGHAAVQRDTLPKMMQLACRSDVGVVHSPMLYMGDVTDTENRWKLYGYKDPVKRGWSFRRVSDKPYKWFGGGGGLTMMKLDDYHALRLGDPPWRRGLGGAEELTDLKFWMFNKTVWIHPDCLYYHWAKSRGFTWKMHEHYWNQLVAYYCLAGREYMEQQNQTFSYPQSSSVLDEVEQLCKEHRQWILDNASYTMEEVLKKQPWLH